MTADTQVLETYSVVDESYQLLSSTMLDHPLYSRNLPPGARELAKKIRFAGSKLPSIPVNWRFAESIAVLKASEGIAINSLLVSKYSIEAEDIEINIDHAQLFIISCLLTSIITDGTERVDTKGFDAKSTFPSCDLYGASASPYRICASNIYRTKDDRFFHLHTDLNPGVVQKTFNLPSDMDGDYESVYHAYQNKCLSLNADELDRLCNDRLRTSGTIVNSIDEYRQSMHGQLNADQALWEIQYHENPKQRPCWWPPTPNTSAQRPLAGLKVVDFSRIIAAPTLTRGLAEYGASVMRVTSSHLPDMGFLHPDMGWGKWNCDLDLRVASNIEKVRMLIHDADVVVYGYRPSVLGKYGLGASDVLKMVEGRDRGIIVAQLDCYGWVGPWDKRSGWQQISDACTGVSMEYGRAIHGKDEPVTPVFPNSDHCAGLAGHIGVICALLRRSEQGGSYTVSCSLNQYNKWLTDCIGLYPGSVWQQVWARHGSPKFRHYHPMQYLFPRGVSLIQAHAPELLDEDFFENRQAGAMGCTVRCVKPVLRFPNHGVKLFFQVSARTNGIDAARWPDDLLVDRIEEFST